MLSDLGSGLRRMDIPVIRFLDEIAARSANQRCQLRKEAERQRAQLTIKTGLHARSYTDVARQGGHIH